MVFRSRGGLPIHLFRSSFPYASIFISLKNVIPCDHCSKHYTKNIQNHPITPHLDNKKKLIEWLIYIHNKVNISLGKRTYTINEVLDEELQPNMLNRNPIQNPSALLLFFSLAT